MNIIRQKPHTRRLQCKHKREKRNDASRKWAEEAQNRETLIRQDISKKKWAHVV